MDRRRAIGIRATGAGAAIAILAFSLMGASSALATPSHAGSAASSAAAGDAASVSDAAAPRAEIAPADCPPGAPGGSTCGTLTVPENRNNPSTRTIGLPYLVMPASQQPAVGVPVLVMTGSSAQSTAVAERLAGDPSIGAAHDIVVLAQRGGSETTAPFRCDPAVTAYIGTMTTTDTPAEEMGDVVTAMQACIADMIAEGGDPSGYNRAQTAADVVDLRGALGYPTWTLMGQGTTTSVMQTVAAIDPAAVAGVVLDGFVPADSDLKGLAYAGLSAALTNLSSRSSDEYPDLPTTLSDAGTLVGEESANGIVSDPVSQRDRYYDLTASDVVTLTQLALGDPAAAESVPFMLNRVTGGETNSLQPFADVAVERLVAGDPALTWLEQCQDWQPFWSADPTQPAAEGSGEDPTPLPGLTTFVAADRICSGIGVPAVDGGTRSIPASGAPALVFASDTDPDLPSDSVSGFAAASFPRSQVVRMQSNGAASATSLDCGLQQLSSWLASPETPVQTDCTDGADRYPVIAADDVHETIRVASVVESVRTLDPLGLVVPLVFGAFAVLWLLGWVITLIVQAARREPVGLLIASGVPPITGVAFLAAAWIVVSGAIAATPGLPLVGVPPLVPWLGILLGVGFLAIIPVWRLRGRGAAALAAGATLVWIAMMVWFAWIAVLSS
ncbi:alpha/beta hydrolase [Cnuibacter physcomitrellae]|uniref:alpha/beta hydrolase n=1 Tax=Cnuibacter physcomitrellae TaxID=1619308 RepID=UPI00217570EF|nr:alpha/beta hydrolase [Cnuibacter physcomitrellae]MCS5496817.1 alpha/beta hydrolase [Cnuibacter physcomitrellae]